MGNINIFKIFKVLMVLYNCRSFQLFSTRNTHPNFPDEVMIEFYIDTTRKVNVRRLHRQFERHICVENYFFIAEEGKISLIVQLNVPQQKFRPDLNFCLN
jgi:hypothetical protein